MNLPSGRRLFSKGELASWGWKDQFATTRMFAGYNGTFDIIKLELYARNALRVTSAVLQRLL